MASLSIASLFSASPAQLPAGGSAGAGGAPAPTRMHCHQQRQPQRRLVAAAVRRRYRGTARKEAALAELIERKVAEAMEACAGQAVAAAAEEEEGCRVAWDEVEEVSRAKADLRRRIAEGADDPLEPFCSRNPLADDCAVVYGDDDDDD